VKLKAPKPSKGTCINRNTTFEPLSVQFGPKLRPVGWPTKRKKRKKRLVKKVTKQFHFATMWRRHFVTDLHQILVYLTDVITPAKFGSKIFIGFSRPRGGKTHFSFRKQTALITSIVRSCFHQLRQLRSVRLSLTFDASHVLVHAFIDSRVDYCYAMPSSLESASGLSTSCNQYCILLPVWWLVSVGTSVYHADPSGCAPLATSQAADHIQDCNNGVQLCSWYVPGVFLWRLYASSDSYRTCQATLCTPWSPHCSGYEIEDIWQSLLSLCCAYCLEQFIN